MIFSPPRHKRECNATAKYWLLAAALLISNGSALAADAAKAGRDGQAFGQSLADKFQFPTEGSGGSVNLGNGEYIKPSDMAPKGDGFYVSEPNVGGLQGIYDSDETMHDVGRGTQNQLWQDAQLKGNPFDPDPAMRDQPGPSTVSGAVYQIITGVSDARAQVPDLTNDPIVNTAGDHILNEGLLESFGDCSVETEVTETSRPVHVPDMEYCDRVTAPAPSNCQVKHELVVERKIESIAVTGSASKRVTDYNCKTTLTSSDFVINSNACEGQPDQRLSGLSVSISGLVGWNSAGDSDNGLWCSYIGSHWTMYSHASTGTPACKGGRLIVPVKIANLGGRKGINTLTVNVKGTIITERLQISADNWYPEECIKAAQKASG